MADSKSSRIEPLQGFSLFRARRFRPFFLTQFLGAFNDNVFRNALVGLLAFQTASFDSVALDSATLINTAAGLFILPFFLFSAIAGQLADKYDKARLIRGVKLAEIVIMLFGGLAVVLHSLTMLLIAIFTMGTQSAFFGPVKYGILPLHLHSDELTAGNAFVQSGTMAAILLGTVAGGLLVDIPATGKWIIAASVVSIATLGYVTSRGIPCAPSVTPEIKVNLNVVASTWGILRSVTHNRTILLSVLGISWFWFFGSVLLAQLPVYVSDVLGGDQPIATLLLATFTLGVVAGSLLCERLSGRRVEIGLVPLGALGLTIFAAKFSLIGIPPNLYGAGLGSFIGSATGRQILIDLFLLSLSAGLYIVPLYSLIQSRSDPAYVSRVIAFNNVVNALFMVAAAITAILMIQAGLTIPQVILAVTFMHVAVVAFIFVEIPEFAMRLVVWVITHSLYRVRAEGIDNIPDEGPAVLACNHVSLVDALIVAAKCRRPVRFVMYYKIYQIPFLNYLFHAAKAIPIATSREEPELLERAYDEIAHTLEHGGLVGIFPEGQLSSDGEIHEFRAGIERIVERTPAPVIPMALNGLWGTFFTRAEGKPAMSRWPRHWLARIWLTVGAPMPAESVNASALQNTVEALYRSGGGVPATP